jgi:O-antigen ligase
MVSPTLQASPFPRTANFQQPQLSSQYNDPAEANLLRRFGFRCALFLVFLRFGYVHELLWYELGNTDTYILFITNTLAIGAALASGSLRRTFIATPARWWLAFLVWLLLATLFSTWKTESSTLWLVYLRNDFAILIIIAGLVMTMKECLQVAYAVALGGLMNVIVGRLLFHSVENGRLAIDFGSIANSNDFAAHLLLVLPFVLFAVLTKAKPVKAVGILVLLGGAYLGATTASRGGLISALAVIAYIIYRTRGMVRAAILVTLPVVALIFLTLLPDAIKSRYATLYDDEAAQADVGAAESLESRRYLLQTSLQLTLHNPLFGVGPGEFANSEGRGARAQGLHGQWQVSHNSYTQVSSEAGIPALILFLGAVFTTFRLVSSVEKRCRNVPQLRGPGILAFCMMLSLIGFCCAILFLSLAYTYHLLFLTGFAIALNRAVQKELSRIKAPNQPARTLSPALPQFPAYQRV